MPARLLSSPISASRHALLFPVVAVIMGISGCRNSCQALCQEMADFAQDECNKEFPKEQVDACMETYHSREIDDDQEETCEDITPTLREEWTCEEVNDYFTGNGGGGGGGSDNNETDE
jgi:hypothetical protein